MDPAVISVLIPIVMFVVLALVIIFVRKYTNDERMAMIEKGMTRKEFAADYTQLSLFNTLRIALLLVGAGIGLMFANLLANLFYDREAAYFSMLLIFGGLGLLVSYFMHARKVGKKPEGSEQP